MIKKTLLTIAIPTYNRSDSLQYLVDLIFPHLRKNLHLLIIDNNSTDDTHIYGTKISKKTEYISYIRNNTNIGGTVNMLRCIEFSYSKYTWLLGDDDDIDISYIDELLSILKKGNCSGYHLLPQSRQKRIINKYIFKNKEDFTKNFYDITALHLMSSNIYNTFEAKKYLNEAYSLVHLQHAFSLFHAKFLENKQEFKILLIPIMKQERIQIKRWSKFTAHIDAMETTYILFGKRLINKEYNIRKKELLRIAILSIFETKDEGFNINEIKRLFILLNISNLFLPTLLCFILTLNKGKHSKYLIIYVINIIFFYKYGKHYKKFIREFFQINQKHNINNYLIRRLSLSKNDFFKN